MECDAWVGPNGTATQPANKAQPIPSQYDPANKIKAVPAHCSCPQQAAHLVEVGPLVCASRHQQAAV